MHILHTVLYTFLNVPARRVTSNKELVKSSGVLTSSISDHNLIYFLLNLKIPRAKPSYVSIRSYKYHRPRKFQEDLQFVPFHMVNFFDDVSYQVEVHNILFLDVFNEHAPNKRIKIKAKPNPFVTPEIMRLMKMRDNWYKNAMKTNDELHWNAYKFFWRRRSHVKSQIMESKGNTNSIWMVINRCLPRKSSSLPQHMWPTVLISISHQCFRCLFRDTGRYDFCSNDGLLHAPCRVKHSPRSAIDLSVSSPLNCGTIFRALSETPNL